MRRTIFSVLAGTLALAMCLVPGQQSLADAVSVKPYIAFGADLNKSQKATVMEQLGVTSEELADYETVEVTNEEEHKYLDSYLDTSVIGTRALSSVKIEEEDAGSGIVVETNNISFCTEEMYTNALVTAGISDAHVTVAAPFEISGTAALVGAMKAYGIMTGEEIDADSADAATNELVLTGELGESIGMEKASQLVALVKDMVVSEDLSSEEEISGAIDEAVEELGITLNEEQKAGLTSLMQKIGGLDLDLDTLQDQAQGIYDKLKDLDIDLSGAQGILEQIGAFFKKIFEAIAEFFQNLF
ncbi:MAG: DUF1002 domain-containing protein [Lachnospiraceae bacterium]|nr:DUF1002 domain-containing protein [Lachnospiraceae bacterium]